MDSGLPRIHSGSFCFLCAMLYVHFKVYEVHLRNNINLIQKKNNFFLPDYEKNKKVYLTQKILH